MPHFTTITNGVKARGLPDLLLSRSASGWLVTVETLGGSGGAAGGKVDTGKGNVLRGAPAEGSRKRAEGKAEEKLR